MFLLKGPNLTLPSFLLVCLCLVRGDVCDDVADAVNLLNQNVKRLEARTEGLPDNVQELTRHVMMMSHQARERVMGEGTSGIVKVRDYTVGQSNYHWSSHTGQSFANIHDHANHEKVYGLGDFMMVMNGVHFRTRHNDFELRRPSTKSGEWLATEEIELPQLPPVFDTLSVEDQVTEVREYIRAFNQQNETIRPYKDFFKPVLCYIEGWWAADTEIIENGFTSLRLQFDAESWRDSADKARADQFLGSDFTIRQNDASLPVTILGVNETTGKAIYGQWNYRILCNPIEEDVPTSLFKIVDDNAYRVQQNISFEDFYMYKGARYVLDTSPVEQATRHSVLDKYVQKIPGLDNIPTGKLGEDSVDRPKTADLNYYNRAYKSNRDGLSSREQLRGFSDGNTFMAMTNQKNVAPLMVRQCVSKRRCKDSEIRVSWMVPTEILYMTPLPRWNPYKLAHSENPNFDEWSGKARGDKEKDPYPGTHSRSFYRWPSTVFDRQKGRDRMPADSYGGAKWVADEQGVAHYLFASGPRTILPEIGDIQETRLRYPILPLHEEGSGVWKALNGFIRLMRQELDSLQNIELGDDFFFEDY